MKLNTAPAPIRTHEGGTAKHINAEQQLRRSVMSCMLWESEFYEDGQSIAKRIAETVAQVAPDKVMDIAIEARTFMKLRHVPLLLCSLLAKQGKLKAEALAMVIQRADELAEFVVIHAKVNETTPDKVKKTLSNQVKKGLALAFRKFNEYELAKYDRDGAVKLRDVLFLCHATPMDGKDGEQAKLWKRLVDGKLATPDTWEVTLSGEGGKDKKASWTRLLTEEKLGALALLRNLRNMIGAGVDAAQIRTAISKVKIERVLPFRFIAAARAVPGLEDALEPVMLKCVAGSEKLLGKTVLLVDVSGSMNDKVSGKSDMSRSDAANALAILLREICEMVAVVAFSDSIVEVPPRRGFALADAIQGSLPHGGTRLGAAIAAVANYDRIIVITDEQAHDRVPDPAPGTTAYMINVASAKNGVGYGAWQHVDGWSEAIVSYIQAFEKM